MKSIALDDIRASLNERLEESTGEPTVNDQPWVWEILIEPLEAIIRDGDQYFRAAISMVDDEPRLPPRSEWIEVEQVWVQKAIRDRLQGIEKQPGLFSKRDERLEGSELVIMQGGSIKALGDGKLGGHLVVFGGPNKLDLDGEFFSPETDFGPHKTSLVFYHHGLDGTLKRRRLDEDAVLKTDDVGIWISAQMEMRDEYEEAVYRLAEQGKLGWSSGTAPNLIEREPVKDGAVWIKSWPLGLDASLTPAPAEPLTKAVPLKTYAKSCGMDLKSLLEGAGEASAAEDPDALTAKQKSAGAIALAAAVLAKDK